MVPLVPSLRSRALRAGGTAFMTLAGLRHTLATIHPAVSVAIGAATALSLIVTLMLVMLHALMLTVFTVLAALLVVGVRIVRRAEWRGLRQSRRSDRKRDRGSEIFHDLAPSEIRVDRISSAARRRGISFEMDAYEGAYRRCGLKTLEKRSLIVDYDIERRQRGTDHHAVDAGAGPI
jgi:hypothetical protein